MKKLFDAIDSLPQWKFNLILLIIVITILFIMYAPKLWRAYKKRKTFQHKIEQLSIDKSSCIIVIPYDFQIKPFAYMYGEDVLKDKRIGEVAIIEVIREGMKNRLEGENSNK